MGCEKKTKHDASGMRMREKLDAGLACLFGESGLVEESGDHDALK